MCTTGAKQGLPAPEPAKTHHSGANWAFPAPEPGPWLALLEKL